MRRSNTPPYSVRRDAILKRIASLQATGLVEGMTVNLKWVPQMKKSDTVGRDLLRMVKDGILVAKRVGCAKRGNPSKSYTVLTINPDYQK